MSWLDALDFDPTSSWLAMGTRALGGEPWLVDDPSRAALLELRTQLIAERPNEVLATPASAVTAAADVVALVEASDVAVEQSDDNALARLGRSVVEDLVILRRGDREWEFEAGVVCFPSRWRLGAKIGRPLREIHEPTTGYDPELADRVTSLLDRLGERIVRRRNWFVHPDAALFQPDRPTAPERVVGAATALDELVLRSERQTLRALPASGRVLFTIATQQAPLRTVVADPDRALRFARYVREAAAADLRHRGVSDEQGAVLLALFE